MFDVNSNNARIVVLGRPSPHDHDDDDDELIKREAFRNAVKQSVREDPSRPIKRAYDATVSAVARGGYLRLNRRLVPEFSGIRASVSRAKRAEVPRIPRNLNDVNINGIWAETWNGDNFMTYQDNAWGVLIFATEENMSILQQCSDIYLDGTFRTTPKPYYQYVTVHGNFHRRVIVLVSCLLSGKTVGHYRQVLQALKIKVRQVTGRALKPKRVVCDFEASIISAVETELPRAAICGCMFHFRQSLYRRVKEIGLTRPYKNDDDFRSVMHKFMSLAFLPVQMVRQNFLLLVASRAFRRIARRYPPLHTFVQYMYNTYITGRFPPSMWNVYMRNRQNRTNNYVEGYHNAWNQRVMTAHPCLWVFIRHLKDAQTLNETSIDAARRGSPPPRPCRKWRRLHKHIRRMATRYSSGAISLNRYWRAMSHLVGSKL